MGLGIESTAFLEHVKTLGVRFDRTAMIGRQNIHTGGYAEDYLRSLGASEVTSFDYSDYEGAENLHDFNLPIPTKFYGRFTAVIDGGTLEHVFNYPEAIANCMRMVALDGHLLILTPTNNYSGHGFYQLSRDLFNELLSSANGFSVRCMLTCRSGTDWRVNPEYAVNGTTWESLLLVAAQKTSYVPEFRTPVQGGHAEMWKGHKTA